MLERARLLGRCHDRLGQTRGAGAPALEAVVQLCRVGARLERQLPDRVELGLSVAREPVHGHDGVQTEARDVREMPLEVGCSGLDRLEAAVRVAAVVLQRPHGRNEHDGSRPQAADAADDVEELLHAHVRPEAALRDDVLPDP